MAEDSNQIEPLLPLLFVEKGWGSPAPPPGPCPDADTIGALIEGTLPAEERQRVEEHIASCERCYEGYATAIAFAIEDAGESQGVEPGGTLIPFEATPARLTEGEASALAPRRPSTPTRLPFRLLWAAAIALCALPAWWLLRPDPTSQTELLARFEGRKSLEAQLWMPDRNRGTNNPEIPEDSDDWTRQSFQAGASTFDLVLATTHGDSGRAQDYADELQGVLQHISSQRAEKLASQLKTFEANLKGHKLMAPEARRQAKTLAKSAEDSLFHEPTFRLGRLIEAALVSANLGDTSFFANRTYRRVLDDWQRENPRRAEPATEDLSALRKAWDTQPRDLDSLKTALSGVQEAFGLARAGFGSEELGPEP